MGQNNPGLVTGVSVGSADITATLPGAPAGTSGSITVTVSAAPPLTVMSIKIEPKTPTGTCNATSCTITLTGNQGGGGLAEGTTYFIAIATLSDGTTTEVTGEVTWLPAKNPTVSTGSGFNTIPAGQFVPNLNAPNGSSITITVTLNGITYTNTPPYIVTIVNQNGLSP
jgi:hypothetical protein